MKVVIPVGRWRNHKDCPYKKRLTQEELGNIVRVQKSAIAKYESGRVVNIKRSILGTAPSDTRSAVLSRTIITFRKTHTSQSRKKSLKKWQTRLNVLFMQRNLLHHPLHYEPNSAELEHICFWIKNKRHHANNVARCLYCCIISVLRGLALRPSLRRSTCPLCPPDSR